MLARRYELNVIVARTVSHSFAALTHEILFLPLEHKIHIFSPPCNILYIFELTCNIFFYYINTSEIPSELSRENFISSHVKITCYLHM